MKGERANSTIIVGDLNISLLRIDTTSRQKIKKNIEDFEIINQLDLTSNSRMHILLRCMWNTL